MKFKSLILLSLALGCGLVAMLGVQQVLSGGNGPKDETVQVLVATQDILPGVPLDEMNVSFKSWSKESVPQGAVLEAKQYQKRASKVPLYAGEVVLQAKLGEEGLFGASASIPEGMRVVTIPVNNTKTNSNMIQPGNRIDILVTYKTQVPGKGQVSNTRTVLEYIEVFAVDRVRNPEAGDSSKAAKVENVSFLLTPEQGSQLMTAQDMGAIQLALRNQTDRGESTASKLDDESISEFEKSKAIEEAGHFGTAEGGVSNMPNTGGKSFKDYLKKTDESKPVAAQTPAATPAHAPVEAPPNVWIIEIYEGHTRREAKIELPVPAADAANPAAGSPATIIPTAPLPAEAVPSDKPVTTAA